jgi:signal transduction histidine kinase
MIHYETIYKKLPPTPENGTSAKTQETKSDPARHISPVTAHELNNILTIVQGYAERLLLRHSADEALQPQLKMISEAARRAAGIIRDATPANANAIFRQHQKSAELAPAA